MTISGERTMLDQLSAELSTQWNARVLEGRKTYAEKYPDSISPASVTAAIAQYEISSFRFDFWAFFYIRFECYLTYQTGEKMQFHGQGGGLGGGGGIYGGGGQPFFVPPSQLPGDSSFFFMPVTVGGAVHFWRGDTNIGSLVGAGIAPVGGFGGTGTWSPGPD